MIIFALCKLRKGILHRREQARVQLLLRESNVGPNVDIKNNVDDRKLGINPHEVEPQVADHGLEEKKKVSPVQFSDSHGSDIRDDADSMYIQDKDYSPIKVKIFLLNQTENWQQGSRPGNSPKEI